MNRHSSNPQIENVPEGYATREADLFANYVMGKGVLPVFNPAAAAKAKRARLEELSQFSAQHAAELRALLEEEAEAKHHRELLEFAARISTRHEAQLRSLLFDEAEAREKLKRMEQFAEDLRALEAGWDPVKHPRAPKGQPDGGRWVDKDGGGSAGPPNDKPDQSGEDGYQRGADGHRVPTAMLDLAHAWWQTNSLLQQSRRDIETLPARIASEYAKRNSGDGYSHIHAQNIAKAQRDLAKAKELAPELEKQQHGLEQQYHDSGYDEIPYQTWTPGETIVGGTGIEEVGRAVHMGGSPAGLKPTGIEFDIALTAATVLQIGRAALRKAAMAAPKPIEVEPAALQPYRDGLGHHVPAKKAFEGAPGYNPKTAPAIPNEELERFGVRHSTVTGAQRSLYREFAKTGANLTWDEVERIETEALVRSGLNPEVARATVRKAIDELKESGVPRPIRIPWGK
jgi:hypothetical protein